MGPATDGSGGVRASAAALALLAGCAHDPLPEAPTVLTEPLEVKCPAVAPRQPDPSLLAALNLEPPVLRDALGDDYLISRADAERTVTALSACSARLDDWKAWAAPDDGKQGTGSR